MNKPFFLDLSLLEICKIVMYDFCHEQAKLCYMDRIHGYQELYSLYKSKTFTHTLQKMLKEDLILQIMN